MVVRVLINYYINMNILQREKALPAKPTEKNEENKQQQDPECVETKLAIWENDQYEQFQVDYLNQVFPDKVHKNTMAKGCQFIFHFLSGSLHYWVQLKEQVPVEEDKLSIKDSKYLQTVFSQQGDDNAPNYNRWGKYFMKKDDFHKKQLQQNKFAIPKGEKVHEYRRGDDTFVIHLYLGNNKQFIPYKQRFQILFLFYIDAVSFVDQENQQWQYFVIYKQTGQTHKFVGVLSKYIFKLTSVKQRHRISQVFIMPAYQKSGHGKELLDLVYSRYLKDKICFQITTQVPSFQYQCLRDYKQLQLILTSKLLNTTLPQIRSKQDIDLVQQDQLLSKHTLRSIKQELKLPGNQIQRLTLLLIFGKILSQPENELIISYFQQYIRQKTIFNRSAFKCRNKVPHITFQGEAPDMKQFFMEKAKEDLLRNQTEIEEIVTETIEGFKRVMTKLLKNKLVQFNQ